MYLQPFLQQMPGRGVPVDAVHDGRFLADAGHLPQQGDVQARLPPTTAHCTGPATARATAYAPARRASTSASSDSVIQAGRLEPRG
jgi:hypothetical protein